MSELRVELDVAHLHPVDQDAARRQLAERLRQVGGVTVAPVPVAAADGTKGVGYDLASLLLGGTLSAATVRTAGKVVVAYLERAKARSVTFRRGDVSVKLAGQSAADQDALLDRLAALVDGDARDGS